MSCPNGFFLKLQHTCLISTDRSCCCQVAANIENMLQACCAIECFAAAVQVEICWSVMSVVVLALPVAEFMEEDTTCQPVLLSKRWPGSD